MKLDKVLTHQTLMKTDSSSYQLHPPIGDGYPFSYKLIILLLAFNTFRPDVFVPGGSVLVYFPAAVLLVLLLLWALAPQKRISDSQTIYLFGIAALMILHFPFVRNQGFAYLALKSFLPYVIIPYLVHIQFIDTYKKVDVYIRLFLIFSIFYAIAGIVGHGKVSLPSLGDENDFGLLMNILVPFGFFLGQEAREKKKKIFYFSATSLFILGNIATFSRGGFLGFLSVCGFFFYKSKRKVAALAFVLILSTSCFFFAPSKYWSEIETINTERANAGTGKLRVEAWKAGWRIFLDHPIVGVGPNNYNAWTQDYYTYVNPNTMWGRAAHSLYFTLLPELGIVGTFFFCGMLWGNYRNHQYIGNLLKTKDQLILNAGFSSHEGALISERIKTLYCFSLAYSGALIAFLVTGAFISVLWYGYFWMLTSFWVMTTNAAREIEAALTTGRSVGGVVDSWGTA